MQPAVLTRTARSTEEVVGAGRNKSVVRDGRRPNLEVGTERCHLGEAGDANRPTDIK